MKNNKPDHLGGGNVEQTVYESPSVNIQSVFNNRRVAITMWCVFKIVIYCCAF